MQQSEESVDNVKVLSEQQQSQLLDDEVYPAYYIADYHRKAMKPEHSGLLITTFGPGEGCGVKANTNMLRIWGFVNSLSADRIGTIDAKLKKIKSTNPYAVQFDFELAELANKPFASFIAQSDLEQKHYMNNTVNDLMHGHMGLTDLSTDLSDLKESIRNTTTTSVEEMNRTFKISLPHGVNSQELDIFNLGPDFYSKKSLLYKELPYAKPDAEKALRQPPRSHPDPLIDYAFKLDCTSTEVNADVVRRRCTYDPKFDVTCLPSDQTVVLITTFGPSDEYDVHSPTVGFQIWGVYDIQDQLLIPQVKRDIRRLRTWSPLGMHFPIHPIVLDSPVIPLPIRQEGSQINADVLAAYEEAIQEHFAEQIRRHEEIDQQKEDSYKQMEELNRKASEMTAVTRVVESLDQEKHQELMIKANEYIEQNVPIVNPCESWLHESVEALPKLGGMEIADVYFKAHCKDNTVNINADPFTRQIDVATNHKNFYQNLSPDERRAFFLESFGNLCTSTKNPLGYLDPALAPSYLEYLSTNLKQSREFKQAGKKYLHRYERVPLPDGRIVLCSVVYEDKRNSLPSTPNTLQKTLELMGFNQDSFSE